ncbi:MAG: hypothetical protein EP346_07250 [Bacteroidetes bacterium]|nr:MAG: hypothetical protein EP346_07250 [Bacteroidota bacterium]
MPTLYRTFFFKKIIARKYRISVSIVQLKNKVEDLNILAEMADKSSLKPVIERVIPFEEGIEKLVENGSRSASGKWVFTL